MFYNYTIFRLMRCLHVNRNLMTLYCLTENFDTDLLDNVNIGPLNEETNLSITQEEIIKLVEKIML